METETLSPAERARHVDGFRAVVAAGGRVDLFRAVMSIAQPEYPRLDTSAYEGRLEAWARAARLHAAAWSTRSPTAARLASVCQVLFQEEGMRGDLEEYTDPRNSFLNEVMDRRRGLPITLSVLFIEVARRAGLEAYGVAFPGHFLARVEDAEDEDTFVVVDSFTGGRILGVDDLKELLDKVSGGEKQVTHAMLEPAQTPTILMRMLRNLKASYAEREDFDRALLAQERLLLLTPDDAREHRDHGLLLFRAHEPAGAVTSLERYLRLVPRAEDARELRGLLGRLKRDTGQVQ